MNEIPFCDEFQDLLDKAAAGTVTPEEEELLRFHARHCEECALLLKIQDTLAAPSIADMAAHIPDGMIAQLTERLAHELPPAHRPSPRPYTRRPRWAWLVPAFGAVAILFILTNIFLFTELRQLRAREHDLTGLLARQSLVLEDLRRERALASGDRAVAQALNKSRLRLLSGRRALSVAELRSFLEQVPPDLQILTAPYVEHLLSQLPVWERVRWRKALDTVDAADGIQSREAITLLDALALDPNDTITPARLAELTEL